MATPETQTLGSPEAKSPVTPSHLVSLSFDLPATYYDQNQVWQENLFYLAWKLPLLEGAQDFGSLPGAIEAFLKGDNPLTPDVLDERVESAELLASLTREMRTLALVIDDKMRTSGESAFATPFLQTLDANWAQATNYLTPSVLKDHWAQSYYYVHTVPYESPQVMMHHQFDDKTAALTYAHTVAFDEVMAYLAKKGCINMRVRVFEHKDGHGKQPV